jgi:MFS family permease
MDPANSPVGENRRGSALRKRALKFVLLLGAVSLFADFAYEGARSITGPFLLALGASGFIASIVAGSGELLGYGLRLFSGRLSERTGKFWPITIVGYLVTMTAVPLLAFAGNWPTAVGLILLERIGKAIRKPPRDVMLSHAAGEMGMGWGFGLHEALDQCGALIGPLVVAFILAHSGEYRLAFAVLAIPAAITILLLLAARFIYPHPEELAIKPQDMRSSGLSRSFWIYLTGAALVAAGFADFQLIAFHFVKAGVVAAKFWIPIFYSIAMAVSGVGSLVFGRLFDRFGIVVLVPLTLISALFAPLVFLGGFWVALIGAALWGMGMGVHDSIIPAAVAGMVSTDRRPSAYGLFTGAYGLFWFLGSAAIGGLYDHSVPAAVAFCMVAEFAAVPFFLKVRTKRTQT